MMTSLLLLLGCLVVGSEAVFENEYAVVIEALTGETLVNCYQWRARNVTTDPILELKSLGNTVRGPRTPRAREKRFFFSFC